MARDIPQILDDLDSFWTKLNRFAIDHPGARIEALVSELQAINSDLRLKLPTPGSDLSELPPVVSLSRVTSDFESINYQLKSNIAAAGNWKDFLVSSTGVVLLEHASAIGVYNQYNIELAAREAFPTTALRDSSIYSATRMLGVKIGRKMPGRITLDVKNTSTSIIVIPPKSKFAITGRIPFFTKTSLTVYPGASAELTIYSGEPKVTTFTVPEIQFFEYIIPDDGFKVSSATDDFRVTVVDRLGKQTAWTSTDQPLWNHGYKDQVYFESSTGEGKVSLIFGDGTYGKAPGVGDTIMVEYVTLTGLEITGAKIGDKVTYPGNKDISAVIKSIVGASVEEKPSLYYKIYAPHIFKARGRAINKTDYVATILSDPEVASCIVHGQRDLFPNDPKWMNTIRICILPFDGNDWGGINPNPTSVRWTQFLDWMKPKVHEAIQIQTWNPSPQPTEVIIKVAIKQEAVYEEVYSAIYSNIIQMFEKDMYSLGKRIYLSDLDEKCRIAGVDYIQILSPEIDVFPADAYTYLTLGNLVLTVFYSERKSLPSYR